MPTKRCCAEVKRCVLRRAMRMPCRPCSKRSAARADGNHAFSRQRTSSTARRVAARTSSHNGGLLTRAERGRQQEETRREQRTNCRGRGQELAALRNLKDRCRRCYRVARVSCARAAGMAQNTACVSLGQPCAIALTCACSPFIRQYAPRSLLERAVRAVLRDCRCSGTLRGRSTRAIRRPRRQVCRRRRPPRRCCRARSIAAPIRSAWRAAKKIILHAQARTRTHSPRRAHAQTLPDRSH